MSSYGTVVGEGGGGGGLFHEVRTPSSGVPSIAQLHRHLSNTTQGTQAYNYFTNKPIFVFKRIYERSFDRLVKLFVGPDMVCSMHVRI